MQSQDVDFIIPLTLINQSYRLILDGLLLNVAKCIHIAGGNID